MMQIFSVIINHCIRIGLENNCSTLKKLSLLSYRQLKEYPIPSKYKLNVISQAAGRLVQMKKDIKSMIAFEDLKGIRKLYKKGNGQGNNYRRKLNSWSFYEFQRQVEYKAKWEGIPIKFVDPKRTSKFCPICEGVLQEDKLNRRKLLCINCNKMMDRDVVASMNIGYKGWARFTHPRGLPDEAMKGNVDRLNPLILRVHGSKLVAGYV